MWCVLSLPYTASCHDAVLRRRRMRSLSARTWCADRAAGSGVHWKPENAGRTALSTPTNGAPAVMIVQWWRAAFFCTDRYAVCGHLSVQTARKGFIGRGAFAYRWDHRCGGENASPSPAAADDFRFESKKLGKISLPREDKRSPKKRPKRPDGLGFAGNGPRSEVARVRKPPVRCKVRRLGKINFGATHLRPSLSIVTIPDETQTGR